MGGTSFLFILLAMRKRSSDCRHAIVIFLRESLIAFLLEQPYTFLDSDLHHVFSALAILICFLFPRGVTLALVNWRYSLGMPISRSIKTG